MEDRLTILQILHRTPSSEILEEFATSRAMRQLMGFLKIYKKYVQQGDRDSERLYEQTLSLLNRFRADGAAFEASWDALEEILQEQRRYPEGVQRQLAQMNQHWRRAIDYQKAKRFRSRSRSASRRDKVGKKSMPRKKQVRFNDKIKSVRYYCLTDEPTKEVPEEEYIRFKESSTRHLNFNSLKHQECKMEGKNKNFMMAQEEQKTKEMEKVAAEIVYSKPRKVEVSGEWAKEGGEESQEKSAHGRRIASKLSCFYISE